MTKRTLFVGTWSSNLYILELDTTTGALTLESTQHIGERPSFLALDPSKSYLYAVNETKIFNDKNDTGGIVVYDIKNRVPITSVPSLGTDPCHLSVDSTGRHLLFANYNDNANRPQFCTFGVYSLGTGGKISSQPTRLLRGEGTGPNTTRQDQSHPHQFIIDPQNKFAFLVDLGSDKIHQYLFNAESKDEVIMPNPVAEFVHEKPGSGPRHLAFHPNLQYAYLARELDNYLTVYSYDAKQGTLSAIQTISLLPDNVNSEKCSAAEVQVSPDGRFLYASNRGEADGVAIFRVDADSGKLTLVGHQSTGGNVPRFFLIDESGDLLLAANQESNNIVVFKRDAESGLLTELSRIDGIKRPTHFVLL